MLGFHCARHEVNLKEQLTLNGVSQFYISVEEMLGSQGFSARSLLKTTDKSQWLPLGKLHQMLECLTSFFSKPSVYKWMHQGASRCGGLLSLKGNLVEGSYMQIHTCGLSLVKSSASGGCEPFIQPRVTCTHGTLQCHDSKEDRQRWSFSTTSTVQTKPVTLRNRKVFCLTKALSTVQINQVQAATGTSRLNKEGSMLR